MGNNLSFSTDGGGGELSPRVQRNRPLSCAQRTHSLPICHHDHRQVHCHRFISDHHGDRPVRPSRRFRKALPGLVNNVSTALGGKLYRSNSTTGKGKSGKRHSTGLDEKNQEESQFRIGGGGKNEKRTRSKTREHCRLFRQVVSDWRLCDLHCLVVEFESALAVRELGRKADAARSPASTIKDDFRRLYFESKSAHSGIRGCDDPSSDTVLYLDGERFAVHRALLSKRCRFFRRMLVGSTGGDCNADVYVRPVVPVVFPSSVTPLTPSALAAVIEYLYTESSEAFVGLNEEDFRSVVRFNYEQRLMTSDWSGRCGDRNREWTTLEEDIESMYYDSEGRDAVLLFTNNRIPPTGEQEKLANGCQFRCHSFVLAARSPFFRNMMRKRQRERRSGCGGDTASSELLEIVLDESVLPRRYAPVLLRAMYSDHVDLSLVPRDGAANASSCLTEVKAIAAGKCQLSPIDQATDLYQIGRFLEFDKLVQGCEDIIVAHITMDDVTPVYNWASESHGSGYVRRKCVDYLCQEFSRFCTSPLLIETNEELLKEVLESDYVQASELEILSGVIRWGEHQLARRLEEREPNILAGTTHSISRKGVKRTDLSDKELKDVLAGLLPLVRVDYILPANHSVLENALSRGLVTPSTHDPLSEKRLLYGGSPRRDPCWSTSTHTSAVGGGCWSHPHRHSAGPRLYVPYLLEARTLLEKRVADAPDQLSTLINHHPPIQSVTRSHFAGTRITNKRYPDTLYMIDGGQCNDPEIMVLPDTVSCSLRERVDYILRNTAAVRRALTCGCSYHRSAVLKQVRLQAVRECGLSDSTISLLDSRGGPLESDPSTASLAVKVDDYKWIRRRTDNDGDAATSDALSPVKRRFQSQPELSQCNLSVCVDWPDLMRSSMGSCSSPRHRSPCYSDCSPRMFDQSISNDPSSSLQRQLVDLTQQICDLVVVSEGNDDSTLATAGQ